MVSNPTIELVDPDLDLVPEFMEALAESYEEHRRFLHWAVPSPNYQTTYDHAKEAISNFQNRVNELRFGVRRVSDRRLVGCIGLLIRDMLIPYFEIGYWIRSSEAGKGYTSMAVPLLEQYAIEEFSARRIEIKMGESNVASRRVAEKAGFKYEATIHLNRRLPNGEVDNTIIYYKTYS